MAGTTASTERPIAAGAHQEGSTGGGAPELTKRGKPTGYAAILCLLGLHSGKWAYLAEGTCGQFRDCPRCGRALMRVKHHRRWQYTKTRECEQTKVCTRCDESKGHRTRHTWGPEWETGSWVDRKRNHQCQRCGRVESWAANSES